LRVTVCCDCPLARVVEPLSEDAPLLGAAARAIAVTGA